MMKIEQFEDKNLSHYSYAILSAYDRKIILIDPSRNIEPYLAYASLHQAKIIGVIETHPHADFVSGHLELHKRTKATLYCSKLLDAAYPHHTFDDGDKLTFGEITLKAINTPGHSPDSICILLEYEGKDKAVFTGDTLFIGDCGRPDLREQISKLTVKRKELAVQMYHSLRDKLMTLNDEVWVYPAHGAGTLCGKALSEASRSTIGDEKRNNWSLQKRSEEQFIEILLEDQPHIPKYFPYDVELNKHGAMNLQSSVGNISIEENEQPLNPDIVVVDARPEKDFKSGHLPGAINIPNGVKFETWLGSIIAPEEAFYLLAENRETCQNLILRSASIGYEHFIEKALLFCAGKEKTSPIDQNAFKAKPLDYTVVDVRSNVEVRAHTVFEHAIHIPLDQLRERAKEIPSDKPIVVHCVGGYRSAIGSSLLNNVFKDKTKVFDLGSAIKDFL